MILCFDYGKKYIGVALGEEITYNVFPITTVVCRKNFLNWKCIIELINYWNPNFFVVGISYNENYTDQLITFYIRDFIKKLFLCYNLPIYLINEYLTTWNVKKIFSSFYYENFNFNIVNKFTASILLDNWINEIKN